MSLVGADFAEGEADVTEVMDSFVWCRNASEGLWGLLAWLWVSLLVGVFSLKGSWVHERGQLSLRVELSSLRGSEQRQSHPRHKIPS